MHDFIMYLVRFIATAILLLEPYRERDVWLFARHWVFEGRRIERTSSLTMVASLRCLSIPDRRYERRLFWIHSMVMLITEDLGHNLRLDVVLFKPVIYGLFHFME